MKTRQGILAGIVEVVGYVDVEESILVGIQKDRIRGPIGIGQTCGIGYVVPSLAALIQEEAVGSKQAEVQIEKTIPIDVPHGCVSCRGKARQSRCVGHVYPDGIVVTIKPVHPRMEGVGHLRTIGEQKIKIPVLVKVKGYRSTREILRKPVQP